MSDTAAEPKVEKPVRMVKCPGCDLELPHNDYEGQISHMQANHEGIAEDRRIAHNSSESEFDYCFEG